MTGDGQQGVIMDRARHLREHVGVACVMSRKLTLEGPGPAGTALLRGPTLAQLMVVATFRQEVVNLQSVRVPPPPRRQQSKWKVKSKSLVMCPHAPYVHGPRGPFDFRDGTTFYFFFVCGHRYVRRRTPHGGGVSGN